MTTTRHYKVQEARQAARQALAEAGFRKFCVVMESWEGGCKRIARYGFSAEQAMADAQMACPGWMPAQRLAA